MSTSAERTRQPPKYADDPDFRTLCAALLASHGNRAAAAAAIGVSRQHLTGALLERYPAAARIFPRVMGRPRRALSATGSADKTYAASVSERAEQIGLGPRFVASLKAARPVKRRDA